MTNGQQRPTSGDPFPSVTRGAADCGLTAAAWLHAEVGGEAAK
jgi:hypothetical protein